MAEQTGNLTTAADAGVPSHKAVASVKSQDTANLPVEGRSTEFYPGLVQQPDGVPDAYRLPSGQIVYQDPAGRWHAWDSKLPLILAPEISGATPLYLTGQQVASHG